MYRVSTKSTAKTRPPAEKAEGLSNDRFLPSGRVMFANSSGPERFSFLGARPGEGERHCCAKER